ncbi:hypothetical protein MF271_20295 (plasmid) [Deinococcus sp. KNUC1210]|uniref:hypothetical protein n=1 Tax=Deinococcus sp. KNUC1210 TaxID=2917691 RepID=UPI001EF00C48|nr:hypothetical protein [Deinococcus sp. KNUC1210]ULH17750.1 hypothetical protein MF271_20295 [Deinococcus sp. KNUC1210]
MKTGAASKTRVRRRPRAGRRRVLALRPRRRLALFGLIVLALLLGLVWRARHAPTAVLPEFGAPTLKVTPDATGVTFRFSAAAGSPLPAGVPLRIVLSTPAGPLLRQSLSGAGQASVRIPYVRAGLTVYDALVGPHSYHGQWRRVPGAARTPLQPKVGARAVRVVSDPPPALVLHPQDAQQNVSDQPVTVRTRQPDGSEWTRQLPVKHLLAWSFLPVGTHTGTLQVVVSAGQAHGERAEVDLLPGPAAQASVSARRDSAPASGRDPWQLDVSDLKDRLGNPVVDGSSVSLESVGENGPLNFSATRPSAGGDVLLEWPAAPQPGQYRLSARSGNASSSAVKLTSTRPLDVPDLPVRRSGNTLLIGPVLTALGALPDDGTPVAVRFLMADGRVVREDTTFLTAGQSRYVMPALPQGTTRAEVRLGGQVSRLLLDEP